jgi:hypothetical protein
MELWDNPQPDYWSQDEEVQLKKLMDEGLSGSEISARIPGRSRNAVIARASRLGFRFKRARGGVRKSLKAIKLVERPKNALVSTIPDRRAGNRFNGYPVHSTSDRRPPLLPSSMSSLFGGEGIPLMQRAPSQCAWPYEHRGEDGQPRCCGNRIFEGVSAPYCLAHCRAAFADWQPSTVVADAGHA